jgi:hypothetical protein
VIQVPTNPTTESAESQEVTATPSDKVSEQARFYALRPEWLESDEERNLFRQLYPEMVAAFPECWPTPLEEEE